MVHFDDDVNVEKVTLLDLGCSCAYQGIVSLLASACHFVDSFV